MVFYPDKIEVARCFRRSQPTYDDNAFIQKKVSARLVGFLQELEDIKCRRVLEVGCCTGILTEMFCSHYPVANLFVNDLVPELCEKARERVSKSLLSIEALPGDIEKIAIPRQLDLILSSSTLQWLTDLPAALDKFNEALADQGYLVFSLFGAGTMAEIKTLTGCGLHYLAIDQLCSLVKSRFDLLRVETSEDRLVLPTPRDVLRHLQATGVSGLGYYRWTPATLRIFESEYRRMYGSEEGVQLSYVSHFLVARKKLQGGVGGER